MKKLDTQELSRLINKLEEKFNSLDVNDLVRGNVSKDFADLKEELRKNPSEERIIERLKLFLNGLRDYSFGNRSMNNLVTDLDEYIRKVNSTIDF